MPLLPAPFLPFVTRIESRIAGRREDLVGTGGGADSSYDIDGGTVPRSLMSLGEWLRNDKADSQT